MYTSRKIGHAIKPKERNPPNINQQRVVYYYKCSLCDANYVGYTCQHLYQRVEEHIGSLFPRPTSQDDAIFSGESLLQELKTL